MKDVYNYLAEIVLLIRSDKALKESFNRILAAGSMTQQVRVAVLLGELEKNGAPEEVKKFIQLLTNDQLAHQVLQQINKE